ncbi:MAG: zwf, glucose-6-phosphate 1-dehydrogenase [Candidatus Saccharibacteria bacterium]|nr:zwf, glucose-6-phosphate 1-dehydrogenase [Candidatus Saccharibacteria bacterium]
MQTEPAIIVLFGITGDLSKRKLLPAIFSLHNQGLLHDKTVLLGSSRREVSPGDIISRDDFNDEFASRLEMIQYDPSEDSGGTVLKSKLDEIEQRQGVPMQRLFYLSIPPETLSDVVRNMATAGLNDQRTRLLIEKPYGHDLASAEQLTKDLAEVFSEEQIYRIDHFLAKDMVQGITTFRERNGLFNHLLSNEYVSSIYVRGHETLDIQGRGDFYEQTGALRDLIQSHLLQILAVTASTSSKKDFLESLIVPEDITNRTARGQYEGYRDEAGQPDSTLETFAAIELTSSDPNWQGVTFVLETGKALPHKITDVTVTFKATDLTQKAAQLVFDIEPEHKISITTITKKPGLDEDAVEEQALELPINGEMPDAYQRVFYDALSGKQQLFVTADEALACWRVVQPIMDAWAAAGEDGLQSYAKGSRGPSLTNLA